LVTANELGIGPMGLSGKTTLLGVKVGTANRVLAVMHCYWTHRAHLRLRRFQTEFGQFLNDPQKPLGIVLSFQKQRSLHRRLHLHPGEV